MKHEKLIVTRETMVHIRDLACEYGVNEALLLQDLHIELFTTGVLLQDGDTRRFAERSYTDWEEEMPWISERTVKRIIAELRSLGVLQVVNRKKANWYTIDYAVLERGSDKMSPGTEWHPPLSIHATQTSSLLPRLEGKEENSRATDESKDGDNLSQGQGGTGKVYTHLDYDWDSETWAQIRETGELPPKQSRASVLVGAYLVLMKKVRGEVVPVRAPEFRGGRLMKTAKQCLAHFNALAEGDTVAGLAKALDYVKWYVTQEEDDFFTEKNWPIDLLFSAHAYRSSYAATRGRAAKRGGKAGKKGSLAASDSTYVIAQDRAEWLKNRPEGEIF